MEDDVSDPSIYPQQLLAVVFQWLILLFPVSDVMALEHFRTLKISCMNMLLLIKPYSLVKPCPILLTFIKKQVN